MSLENKVLGKASGFTLIELLVVISISALTISMLLPALGKARNAASTTRCAMNQKQAATGLQTYCTDNNDYLPIDESENAMTPTLFKSDGIARAHGKLFSQGYLSSASGVFCQEANYYDEESQMSKLGTGTVNSSYLFTNKGNISLERMSDVQINNKAVLIENNSLYNDPVNRYNDHDEQINITGPTLNVITLKDEKYQGSCQSNDKVKIQEFADLQFSQ